MKDIRPLLRRLVTKHGTQHALAYKLGIHPAYLNDVLNGRRDPGPAILAPLGYERVVIYRKTGDEPAL